MSAKLLTEQHLEFKAVQVRRSMHLSKYHIVGNHMSWLNCKINVKYKNILSGRSPW